MLKYHPDKLRGGFGGPLSKVARGWEGVVVAEAYGVLKAALEAGGDGGEWDDGERMIREMVEAARRDAADAKERARLASALAGWALQDAGKGLVSKEQRRDFFIKRRERKRARALCASGGKGRVRERGRRAFRPDFLLRAMQ